MKNCASCGASLPDGAAFCISCGSREFIAAVVPDLDAPQPEKPKIEYDQYGRPIGQNGQVYEQPQYEQPHFTQDYSEQYDSSSGYDNQYGQPQYLEQYAEQMQQNQQYAPQQYVQPQQYAPQQYAQPQTQQYAPQQYAQPQAQQYAPQQYAQPQTQQYAAEPDPEPQLQQHVVQPEPQPQPQQQYVVEPEPEPQSQKEESTWSPDLYKTEPKTDPHQDSKNFKFEKKETPENESETEEEKPKSVKEFISKLKDTKDYSHMYDINNMKQNKMLCILASLGITFWVPLVVKKECASARFYANQGLLIFIIEVICGIINYIYSGVIIGGAVRSADTGLYIHGYILVLLFTAIFFAVPVFLVVTAIQNINTGKVKDIPLVGKLRLLRV